MNFIRTDNFSSSKTYFFFETTHSLIMNRNKSDSQIRQEHIHLARNKAKETALNKKTWINKAKGKILSLLVSAMA
jgi:hypothetical protein